MLPFVDAWQVLYDIAQGIQHLHSQNIMHGDIKPKNVIIKHGRALLCDFAFSRTLESTSNDLLQPYKVGTVPYKAPGKYNCKF
jgi:serine/threonine protein kinase